ncbi:MAG: DUF1611 domain-containing protein [Pirellulaceae bacterium]|nr:DUF1611 domain-containing protein [Pirellulaceae bacterium]
MNRKMVLLTWGYSNPRTAKTAAGLLRYCPEECVAVLDPDNAGRKAREFLDAGGDTPIIGRLDEAPSAKTLVMGIAPPGGRIPDAWRAVLLEAIDRGMNILSGLHDFISNDPQLAAAAAARGTRITDVRKNDFREIARRQGLNPNCFRVHTVGHDCSVGKMVVSLELTNGLKARGVDAHFVATGQTGIMVSGGGLPLDCIVADFVAGAAEQLVLENQHHEVLLVEGQGSLVHPSYSGVTLSLLHGCLPHAMVLIFEAGRSTVGGIDHVPIPNLVRMRELFETMASIHQPCVTLGIAMNGRRVTPTEAAEISRQVEDEMQLPVVDVLREGPERLVEAVDAFRRAGEWRKFGM